MQIFKNRRICWSATWKWHIPTWPLSPSDLYRPSTAFAMVKLYLPNIYKPSIDSAVVKTCSTILHRHWKGFVAIKSCIRISYRCSTGFAVVKTGLLKLYSPSTGNTIVKTGFLKLHRLATWHCSSQNKQDNRVQVFNYLWGSQNWIAEYLQASTSSVVVKIGLSNFYRLSTVFAILQTGLLSLYRASTDFAVVKRAYNSSPDFQLGLQQSKLTCQTSTIF